MTTTATHVSTDAPTTSRPPAGPAPVFGAVPTGLGAPLGTAAPAALTVTVQRTADGTRLTLDGELEATTAPLLDCLVTDTLERQRGALLLDLTRAGFCDVKGLDCLLAARRLARARGRRVVLLGASPLLQRLLRLSGAVDMIP